MRGTVLTQGLIGAQQLVAKYLWVPQKYLVKPGTEPYPLPIDLGDILPSRDGNGT